MTVSNKTVTSKNIEYRKLSDNLIEKICSFVAQGNYNKVAAALAGVSEVALYEWLKQAEIDYQNGLSEEDSLPIKLVQSLKSAEASRENIMIERLISGAMPGERKRVRKIDADGKESVEITENNGEWLAAATYLERRFPDRWARKERTQVTIDEHKQVTITHVEVIKDYGAAGQIIEGRAREIPEKTESQNETENEPELT